MGKIKYYLLLTRLFVPEREGVSKRSNQPSLPTQSRLANRPARQTPSAGTP